MRLHLTKNGPGFDAGEIVVTDQDNGWLVSTRKTCETSAEEHEALMLGMVSRWNACEDVYNALQFAGYGTSHPIMTKLWRAINGEG